MLTIGSINRSELSSLKRKFLKWEEPLVSRMNQRLEESRDIIAKFPDRIPLIVERYSKCDLPELEKKKYLVPRDLSVGHFIHILSSRLNLPAGKALFVFVKNTLPQTASVMDSVYRSFKDEDGFLYMYYSTEKTFGYCT
ncbi:autophagy-related protein 8i isoform X1 [Lathyrus oleraceus]|uniref:autophagy-related protein 8i isoform X1 n=1 Tax=Pisum sativum TaxID=3888 RepID=UPI0021D0EC0C|nr:autophagy-related protein 8i-like isoform X1 [Pisum sativum]